MSYRMCEPCGNYVPVVHFEGDVYCQYCFEAYPVLADPICQLSACRIDKRSLLGRPPTSGIEIGLRHYIQFPQIKIVTILLPKIT